MQQALIGIKHYKKKKKKSQETNVAHCTMYSKSK